jgi:hypothetical protein
VNNAMLYQTRTTPLFPATKRISNLTYYDYAQQISAAAGFCASRFFIANGLFDPDISGSGHQPMGFDQMMLLYTTYTVVRATITVTAMAEVSGAAAGIYLSLTPPRSLIRSGLLKMV